MMITNSGKRQTSDSAADGKTRHSQCALLNTRELIMVTYYGDDSTAVHTQAD
ncbi:hypothetical protein [Mariprofundus erugo]|uniref:hypothetical protein n=1 Tax=Mariprofundus erugo TaxID=2528639 RepID=UPI001375E3FD|nr:hypothetical protein [Mariprofundus erugo]